MANQRTATAAKTEGGEQKKPRKQREKKPLDAKGVLLEFSKSLNSTQADWMMRYFIKPYFKKYEIKTEPAHIGEEIQNGIKEILEPSAVADTPGA